MTNGLSILTSARRMAPRTTPSKPRRMAKSAPRLLSGVEMTELWDEYSRLKTIAREHPERDTDSEWEARADLLDRICRARTVSLEGIAIQLKVLLLQSGITHESMARRMARDLENAAKAQRG